MNSKETFNCIYQCSRWDSTPTLISMEVDITSRTRNLHHSHKEAVAWPVQTYWIFTRNIAEKIYIDTQSTRKKVEGINCTCKKIRNTIPSYHHIKKNIFSSRIFYMCVQMKAFKSLCIVMSWPPCTMKEPHVCKENNYANVLYDECTIFDSLGNNLSYHEVSHSLSMS